MPGIIIFEGFAEIDFLYMTALYVDICKNIITAYSDKA